MCGNVMNVISEDSPTQYMTDTNDIKSIHDSQLVSGHVVQLMFIENSRDSGLRGEENREGGEERDERETTRGQDCETESEKETRGRNRNASSK
jgi:hypothetical protein